MTTDYSNTEIRMDPDFCPTRDCPDIMSATATLLRIKRGILSIDTQIARHPSRQEDKDFDSWYSKANRAKNSLLLSQEATERVLAQYEAETTLAKAQAKVFLMDRNADAYGDCVLINSEQWDELFSLLNEKAR